MRLGEFLLRAENLDVKPSAFLDLFKHPGKGLLAVGHALFAWVILLIPAIVLMSFALQPVFAEIKKRCASIFSLHFCPCHVCAS